MSPRGTSFISGLTSDDSEIWTKPTCSASLPNLPLVRRVQVTVQVHHRDRADPVGVGLPQLFAQQLEIRRAQHRALGRDPLVDLDDPLVQHLRQHNVPVENAGAILVGNAQRVAETAGDHQQRALSLALQQRICRHGGAHPHRLHLRDRHGHTFGGPEQRTDPGNRRVAVPRRVLRQQLVRQQAPVRPACHDVGERTAPVNPKLPPRTSHQDSLSSCANSIGEQVNRPAADAFITARHVPERRGWVT